MIAGINTIETLRDRTAQEEESQHCEGTTTKLWCQTHTNFVNRAENLSKKGRRRPTNLTLVTPVLSGGLGQHVPKPLREACKAIPNYRTTGKFM